MQFVQFVKALCMSSVVINNFFKFHLRLNYKDNSGQTSQELSISDPLQMISVKCISKSREHKRLDINTLIFIINHNLVL
jgi:hypothetical protein